MNLFRLSLSTLVILTGSGLANLASANPIQNSQETDEDINAFLTSLPVQDVSVAASLFSNNDLENNDLENNDLLATLDGLGNHSNLNQPQSPTTEISDLLAQASPDSSVTGDTFSREAQKARQELLIDPLVLPIGDTSGRRAFPGSTFGVPSAYGANWRDVFFGGGLVSSGEFVDGSGRTQNVKADGSIGFGAGFGDAVKTVGVELDVSIISLRDAFADSGAVGFKVHKVFPQLDNLAIAAGWTNPIDWGDAQDAQETVYGVVTKAFDLRPNTGNTLPLTVTAGIGTGAFRSLGAIKENTNDPNFFGSLGLRVIPQLSVITTWSGNQLNMGVSAAPFKQVPFTLTMGAGDITDNRGTGVRFLMTGGFGFSF
jgi:hypothetical protein